MSQRVIIIGAGPVGAATKAVVINKGSNIERFVVW